jgi:cell division protein FtsQ
LETRAELALDRLRGNRLALRTVLIAIVAVPLLGGGWLWLRDSSLVSVRHVHITGVHGGDAIEIRQALANAAGRMTTMDFNLGALRSAVSSYAIVGAVHATTSFPHGVSISVTERPPVAALLTAGQRTAVAADGTALGPGLLSSSLPTVTGAVEPPAGARVREPAALAAVAVLGAAPVRLAAFVVRVYSGSEGLTVAMRNGLLVYFGNATRPHAKWLSLARVLTSPSAAGAMYVDVRLPERPAAGFSSTSSSSASTAVEAGSSEPTAAALAASLSKAAGGSVGASAGSSSGTEEHESTGQSETTTGSSTTSGGGYKEASPHSSTGTGEPSSGSSEASGSGSGESSSTGSAAAGSSTSGASGEAPVGSTGGATSTPVPGG